MVAFADLAAKASLDWVTGKTTPPTVAARYLGLITAMGIDAGTGFTEVSGTNYVRVQIPAANFNASSGSAPSSAATNATTTFPTSGGDWTGAGATPIIGFTLTTDAVAISATNLLVSDYLGNFPWLPATVAVASPGTFTCPAHGFAVNDPIVFTTEFGGTAPTASAGVLTGVLRVVSVTTDTFTVASGGTFTNAILGGGTAVNISASGNGCVRKLTPQLVPNNTAVTFASGNVTVQLG